MDSPSFAEYLHVSKELMHVFILLILAWVLIGLSRSLVRVFRNYMYTHISSAEEGRRVETLARVFRYISTVV